MLNILVIDDEANIRKSLTLWLKSHGQQVWQAGSAGEGFAENRLHKFDLVFLDLRLGPDSGLELLPKLLADSPWLKIVVMTAYSSVDTAVEAMKRGAFDYIEKPFTLEKLGLVLEKVEKALCIERRLDRLVEDLKSLRPDGVFISSNLKMQRMLEMARHVAASEAAVLIRGESGTGKTILAKAIHGWSPRAAQPLGIVSCPTLQPELLASELFGHARGAFTGAVRENAGRIAGCDHGTLFLDEIGDLTASIQPQLLRFLQDHEYERVGDPTPRQADVRLIAATNRNLEDAVSTGAFREDLFYRLNVFQLEIPPLRERPEDIEMLAENMLKFFNAANHKTIQGFSPEALAAIKKHPWPGNLRELRNAVERAVILTAGDTIQLSNLPDTLQYLTGDSPLHARPTLEQLEENYIREVLTASSSLVEAASILGINQTTLWRKRKAYGIDN